MLARGVGGGATDVTLQQDIEIEGIIIGTRAPYAMDETGATSSAEGFQAALEAASDNDKILYLPPGDYDIDDLITLPSGSSVRLWLPPRAFLQGANAVIPDRDALITIGTEAGGLVALPALGAHALKNQHQIEFATPHGLSAGSVFSIIDDDDYSWHSGLIDDRPYYKRGELLRVLTVVSATKVDVDTTLRDDYLTSENIVLRRHVTNTVHIFGGGSIISPGHDDDGDENEVCLTIFDAYQSKLSGISVLNGGFTNINTYRCFDLDIEGVTTLTADRKSVV